MGFKPGSKTSSYSGPHHFKNIYEKLKKACAHSLYTHPFNLYSYMTWECETVWAIIKPVTIWINNS